MGRDTLRLRYAEGGRLGHRAGDHRLLPRTLGALQSAEDRHLRPLAEDFYGKATKIPAARACPRTNRPGLHGKTLIAFDVQHPSETGSERNGDAASSSAWVAGPPDQWCAPTSARAPSASPTRRVIRSQFIFPGKNGELTPDFRHRISPCLLLPSETKKITA